MANRRVICALVIVLTVALFTGSCLAPQFYIPQAERAAPTYIGSVQKDSHVEVVLEHLILPNSPGSWVKDARWYEFVFRIRNASKETVAIDQITMVDKSGIIRPQAESY